MRQATATPQPTTPVTPSAPAAPGTAVIAPEVASPYDVHQALLAARRSVRNEIEYLQARREGVVDRLREGTVSDADKAGLDQQLTQVDQQIAAANIRLAEIEGQVTAAAAVPGATEDPRPQPDPWENGPPEEVVAMGLAFTFILLIPFAIAYARRIWRKSAAVTVTLPPQLVDRMESLERSVDAVAIEVERIGEGQRFVTQLLADRQLSRPKEASAPADRR